MLSSAKMSTSSWGYYVRQEPCRAADYYLGHGQDDGLWLGRGLEALGIEPGTVVSERQLEALFGRALNPETGLQLGRAWRSDGVTGYDLTFSAPKSVSALTANLAALGPGLLGPGDGRGDSLGPEGGQRELDFGPALPGTGGWEKPVPSQAMTDLLVESASDVEREQRFQQAQGRVLAGLRSVSGSPDPTGPAVATVGSAAATATSVPAGLGGREVVVAAHDTATRTALAYLDTHASLSRRGTDGVEQVTTAGLTVAAFTHYTSREGDPQLHTHALVLNKVQCADGTWRTLDGHELYAHKKSAGMIYQAVLRNELVRNLGIQFGDVSKDGQAEIVGIPEPLLEQWSKRTHHVNSEAAAAIADLEKKLVRTLTPAERAAVTKTAVLKTRPDKTHEHPEALSTRWAAEAAALGLDLGDLLPGAQRAAVTGGQAAPDSTARQLTVPEVAAAALTAAGRSRAVFGRAEVAGHVAALLPTTGMPAAEVLATVEQLTDRALQQADAVSLGAPVHGATHRASDARYATLEVLQAETRILDVAESGQRSGAGRVDLNQLRQVLGQTRAGGVELDRSQVEALLHLTSRGNTLDVLTAPAGAGKTATLGACASAWHAAGYRVIGLAPSARAAAELGSAITAANTGASVLPGVKGAVTPGQLGSRTDTLAKWLHTRATQPDLDQPGAVAYGSRAGWARLDAKTVLIVDEASMASTLDLDLLTQAARSAGAKVVLVGDPGQIGVIDGPGGMLATLISHNRPRQQAGAAVGVDALGTGYCVALTSIHRFSQEWEKQASLALRDGQPGALDPYQAQGRLHPCPDSDTAADAVFAHWQHATQQGADALMLARTRGGGDAIDPHTRAAAHALGHLTGPVTTLGGRDWQEGDLLRSRKNSRQLTVGDGNVRNGDRYRVLGLHPDGGLVVEDLTGRGRTTLPAGYVAKHCEYGWAATIDGSQGATCDLGLLLVRPGLDREHLYVGMTRGRHGNHAYLTPDSTAAPDSHLPTNPGRPRDAAELERDCLQMLQTALAVSGAQDSATTALARVRADQQRKQAPLHACDNAPDEPDLTAARLQPAASPVPDMRSALTSAVSSAAERELAAARAELSNLEQQHAELRDLQRQQWQRRSDLERELGVLPRWGVARRHRLTADLATLSQEQQPLPAQVAHLDRRLDSSRRTVADLQRQVDDEQRAAEAEQTRALLADRLARAAANRSKTSDDEPPGWTRRGADGSRGPAGPTPRGRGLESSRDRDLTRGLDGGTRRSHRGPGHGRDRGSGHGLDR